jgi:hypothetical protein
MNRVFVIHKDGKRLEKDQSGRTIKVAYLKKGSAAGVVTNMVNIYLTWELNLSEYRDKKEWDKAFNKEKLRYQIVEYAPVDTL